MTWDVTEAWQSGINHEADLIRFALHLTVVDVIIPDAERTLRVRRFLSRLDRYAGRTFQVGRRSSSRARSVRDLIEPGVGRTFQVRRFPSPWAITTFGGRQC
jgi:hypothetical protein